MSYREAILRSFGGKITITMKNLKDLIWEIDKIQFGGEIRRQKGTRYAIGYHRDSRDAIRPYNVDISKPRNNKDGYIHIGAPGDEDQIKWIQNQYGLETNEDIMFAIAEDILLEIAYEVFDFDKIKSVDKETLIGCVRAQLFGRFAEDAPEIVQDAWDIILQNIEASDIKRVAGVDRDIHTVAKKRLEGIKPFVLLLRSYRDGKSCEDTKLFASYYEKYPLEITNYQVMKIMRLRTCGNILKYLREAGHDIESAIYSTVYSHYDAYSYLDELYLKNDGIFTEFELDIIRQAYIRTYAKAHRVTLKIARQKTGFL